MKKKKKKKRKKKEENGHSGVKVGDTTSGFLLLWHCIVWQFWVVLLNTVKKKMVGESSGSEVLTTLNRLPVTRSWNFGSTWANGDSDLAPNKMVINYNSYPVLGELFDALSRCRCNFRFWKRKWRQPRWQTEAEVAPAPWWGVKNSPYTTPSFDVFRSFFLSNDFHHEIIFKYLALSYSIDVVSIDVVFGVSGSSSNILLYSLFHGSFLFPGSIARYVAGFLFAGCIACMLGVVHIQFL